MGLDYNTWIEVYSIESHNKWEVIVEESINNIQNYLTHRNPEKYRDFLEGLEKIKLVLTLWWVNKKEQRLEILRKMYYALRLYDDIMDGDTLRKMNTDKRLEIANWEKFWLYNILINEVKDISKEIWKLEWINYSINEIVSSINFDLNRIMDNEKVRKKSDLDKNFHKMDIDWTIYWTAIIFWLNPESTILKLDTLWEATRIAYNLNDLIDDIKEWLINISKEDLKSFWIIDKDLELIQNWEISSNIKNWINSEINKIRSLLVDYNNKFWLFSILKWRGIELEDNFSYPKKVFYNIILKYLVLKKWYIKEINETVSKFNN